MNFENRGLHYKIRLLNLEKNKRVHYGIGFVLMKKYPEQVTLLNANTMGLVSLEEGYVDKNRLQLVGKPVGFSGLAK